LREKGECKEKKEVKKGVKEEMEERQRTLRHNNRRSSVSSRHSSA
jgi:hypothetical protein